jgi:hypothetical protein
MLASPKQAQVVSRQPCHWNTVHKLVTLEDGRLLHSQTNAHRLLDETTPANTRSINLMNRHHNRPQSQILPENPPQAPPPNNP